jgi:hypothetical protein
VTLDREDFALRRLFLGTVRNDDAACGFVFADLREHRETRLFHGGTEMFELAATSQRRFKGLTLLVDRDGMEIDVRHLIVLGVALLAMHVGDNNDLDQCCNGAAVASAAQLPHAKLHRVLTREDDHGNLCRAYEVHRSRNPQR